MSFTLRMPRHAVKVAPVVTHRFPPSPLDPAQQARHLAKMARNPQERALHLRRAAELELVQIENAEKSAWGTGSA